MKICVLNVSPKGKDSVTMQYVRFLALAFPSHPFVIENVGHMRAFFKPDHAYDKKHGLYDFPHNDLRRRLHTSLFSFFLSVPQVRKKAEQQMNEHMIQPFARVFSESPVLKRREKKD